MMPDGNIGGPVYIPKLYNGKNKTFFFFGYQRLHEKKYAQVFQTVPTLEMRQGLFDFPARSDLRSCDDAAQRRRHLDPDPFPGNRIPLNRIDPVALKVLQLDPWVAPNQAGAVTNTGPNNNVLADEFARTFFNDYNLRIDHQLSNAFKLNGSFTQNDISGYGRPTQYRFDRLDFDGSQGNYSPVPHLEHFGGLYMDHFAERGE